MLKTKGANIGKKALPLVILHKLCLYKKSAGCEIKAIPHIKILARYRCRGDEACS